VDVKRFTVLTFGAVLIATAILAGLAYLSLRHWEASALLLFREQARDMALMAAEKIQMTIEKSEEEYLGELQRLVLAADFRPEEIGAWQARTPLVDRVYLVDRGGRLLYPRQWRAEDRGLLAEIPQGLWDRGERRHVLVGDRVVTVAVLRGGSHGPLLAILGRDEEALRRDVLPRALGGVEGKSVLAVLDRTDRTVYASQSLAGAQRILTVNVGEALPAWRVAFYQPSGVSPKAMVRRQTMIFMAAFVLLLVVIVLGLGATYRLVRRESEMARLKSDFVANVSHDLKTPLSLIRMFAETLELGRVTDETVRREYYGIITRESERLTRLIDNVLDFSRIEGGRQSYDIFPNAVEPLIQEVLDAFRYPLIQQGFKVDVAIEPGLPEVPLDPAAFKQALANLVDNAIKYSGESRRLRVSARRAAATVCVEVADEGVGIPAGEIERIFEKFYRVGRSETAGRRGSGVGLALVKHVALAHGGRVSVDSRPGEGSRFTLHLPISHPPRKGGSV
jgi:signal transduction histidine kinase